MPQALALPTNILIEFTGLAGAGKSTISRVLAEKLHEQGAVVRGPTTLRDRSAGIAARLSLLIDLILRRTVFLMRTFGWMRSSYPKTSLRSLRTILNAPYWMQFRADVGNVLILDEGLVHKVWVHCLRSSLIDIADATSMFEAAYRNLTLRPVFVQVSVRAEEAAARIGARTAAGFFEKAPVERRLQLLSDGVELVDKLTVAAASATGGARIVLDGNESPAANAQAIIDYLARNLG
jgi:hypothetical protein